MCPFRIQRTSSYFSTLPPMSGPMLQLPPQKIIISVLVISSVFWKKENKNNNNNKNEKLFLFHFPYVIETIFLITNLLKTETHLVLHTIYTFFFSRSFRKSMLCCYSFFFGVCKFSWKTFVNTWKSISIQRQFHQLLLKDFFNYNTIKKTKKRNKRTRFPGTLVIGSHTHT